MIIFFSGNVGTGKTTLAKATAKHFNFFYLDADAFKKEVYSEDPVYQKFFEVGKPVPDKLRAKLYIRLISELTVLKNKHKNIVVNETLHTKLNRNKLLQTGKKLFGKSYIILVKSSMSIVKARINRKRRGHLLKNTYAMHLSIKPLAEFPSSDLVVYNNSEQKFATNKIFNFINKLLKK